MKWNALEDMDKCEKVVSEKEIEREKKIQEKKNIITM